MKSARTAAVWLCILILISVDQGIKYVINSKHLQADNPIFAPWLIFKPMFNRDYSWFNSMLQLGIGKWVHILVVFVMIVFIYLFYKFISTQFQTTVYIHAAFAFLFAGATCSLIDKVFWNGSLDYILVKGFFTFDLKDVYINVFIGLAIILIWIDHQGIRTANDRLTLKAFVKFVKQG